MRRLCEQVVPRVRRGDAGGPQQVLVGCLSESPVRISDCPIKLSSRDTQILTDHAHGRRLGVATDNDRRTDRLSLAHQRSAETGKPIPAR